MYLFISVQMLEEQFRCFIFNYISLHFSIVFFARKSSRLNIIEDKIKRLSDSVYRQYRRKYLTVIVYYVHDFLLCARNRLLCQ